MRNPFERHAADFQERIAGELRSVLESRLARRPERLDELADELVGVSGLPLSPATTASARDLVRRYAIDRALVESTTLIDAEGEPDAGIQPFRDSLVHSLALSVVGQMLDGAGVPAGRPVDADPQAVLEVLEQAYRLLGR